MSKNERAFAMRHLETYILIRIYEYDESVNNACFFVFEGEAIKQLVFDPI